MIRWSLLVFGCLLVFRHGVEAAVADTTCTANGNECSGIANSFCDVGNSVCKCVDIATEDTAANTCPLTACPNGASDCSADTNSECSPTSTTCTCKAAYYLDGADDANLCVGKPVGTTCALGECSGLTGQVCDNTLASPVCACNLGYTDSSGTCTANGLGGTCTASGYECIANPNAFCDASSCACGAAFTGDPCVGVDCTSSLTAGCIALDANSECVLNACACKANYALSLKGTSGLCQPGVGATCTASGNECQYLLGGYCDTTVCACADIMLAAGAVCATTICTADATCTALDANSECIKDTCMCKSGYEHDGTSKSCVATGGSNAITASIAVMLMSLLVSVLQH